MDENKVKEIRIKDAVFLRAPQGLSPRLPDRRNHAIVGYFNVVRDGVRLFDHDAIAEKGRLRAFLSFKSNDLRKAFIRIIDDKLVVSDAADIYTLRNFKLDGISVDEWDGVTNDVRAQLGLEGG